VSYDKSLEAMTFLCSGGFPTGASAALPQDGGGDLEESTRQWNDYFRQLQEYYAQPRPPHLGPPQSQEEVVVTVSVCLPSSVLRLGVLSNDI